MTPGTAAAARRGTLGVPAAASAAAAAAAAWPGEPGATAPLLSHQFSLNVDVALNISETRKTLGVEFDLKFSMCWSSSPSNSLEWP